MNDLDYIVAHLSVNERLAQLAEEAAELAQAALKMRRAFDGENPTPITTTEARAHLTEELADVIVAASVALPEEDRFAALSLSNRKSRRWRERLEERKRKENAEKPLV